MRQDEASINTHNAVTWKGLMLDVCGCTTLDRYNDTCVLSDHWLIVCTLADVAEATGDVQTFVIDTQGLTSKEPQRPNAHKKLDSRQVLPSTREVVIHC